MLSSLPTRSLVMIGVGLVLLCTFAAVILPVGGLSDPPGSAPRQGIGAMKEIVDEVRSMHGMATQAQGLQQLVGSFKV